MRVFTLVLATQSAGAVEYNNCISAEGVNPPPHLVSLYDIKLSNGEDPALEIFRECRVPPSLPLLPSPL